MPRFKSRVDGFKSRKPVWICKACDVVFTAPKPALCTHCEHTKFIYFPSQKEYKRYQELCLMEKAGEIADIELQPAYPLTVNGKQYRCTMDFRYTDKRTGKQVVEDVKTSGTDTDISKIKRDLAEEQHNIKVILI